MNSSERKLDAALQTARLYCNNIFPKEYVIKLKDSNTNDVFQISNNVVCKVGCRKTIAETPSLFLRDAELTNFLLERNISVVPFAENFPKVPQMWPEDNFLLTFRKYIPNKRNNSHLKGIGTALAAVHKELINFNLDRHAAFKNSYRNIANKRALQFPAVHEIINDISYLDIKTIKRRCCNLCVKNLFKMKLMCMKNLGSWAAIKEQYLYGDFTLSNVLQTETGIILNDLESSMYGPIEFDLASFLIYAEPEHTKQNQTLFLEEYQESRGKFNKNVLELFCEIHSIQRSIRVCPQSCAQRLEA